MTPEGELQAAVIRALIDALHLVLRVNQGAKGGRNLPARWWSAYFSGGQQQSAGISDVLSLGMDGRLYCWELKTSTGKARQAQLDFQAEARRRGAQVAIVRSVDELRGMLA